VKPHSLTHNTHTHTHTGRARVYACVHTAIRSLISGRSICVTVLSTASKPLRKFTRHNQTTISFPSPTFQVLQVTPISLFSALNDFSSSLPARSPAAAADLLSAHAAHADRSGVHNRALVLINRPSNLSELAAETRVKSNKCQLMEKTGVDILIVSSH